MGTTIYTPEQVEYVRRQYTKLHCNEMAKHLCLPESAIRYILNEKIGIKLREFGTLSKRWSEEEITILKDPNLTDFEKIKLLPERTDASVRTQRRRLSFKSKSIIFKRQFKQHGYLHIRKNNRYVRRSREIASARIGRELKTNEVVHHINGDKLDDRADNLWVCTRAEHNRIHSKTMELINQLMETDIIEFDKEKGEYVLCRNL